MACSSAAASATVRVIGPAVSWVAEIGTMPARLTRPTVGRRPTSPWAADGLTMLPDVSVPMVTIARPAAAGGAPAGPRRGGGGGAARGAARRDADVVRVEHLPAERRIAGQRRARDEVR